jgi:hypothetical protein
MDPGLLGALGALLSGANREGDGGPGGGPGMGSIAILTVPGRGIVGTAITPNGPGHGIFHGELMWNTMVFGTWNMMTSYKII